MARLRDPDRPVLVCPQCKDKHPGNARIGNRKAQCATCNRFAQAVRRRTATVLLTKYPTEAAAIRTKVERQVYRATITTQTKTPAG